MNSLLCRENSLDLWELSNLSPKCPSSCGAIHTFELPNTKLKIMFPKACMVRPSGDARLRGVTPDHEVSDNPFTQEDEILDAALQLIKVG